MRCPTVPGSVRGPWMPTRRELAAGRAVVLAGHHAGDGGQAAAGFGAVGQGGQQRGGVGVDAVVEAVEVYEKDRLCLVVL